MNTQTIATGIVQILVKGLEKAQAALSSIPKSLTKKVEVTPEVPEVNFSFDSNPAESFAKSLSNVSEEMAKVIDSQKKSIEVQDHLWDTTRAEKYISRIGSVKKQEDSLLKEKKKETIIQVVLKGISAVIKKLADIPKELLIKTGTTGGISSGGVGISGGIITGLSMASNRLESIFGTATNNIQSNIQRFGNVLLTQNQQMTMRMRGQSPPGQGTKGPVGGTSTVLDVKSDSLLDVQKRFEAIGTIANRIGNRASLAFLASAGAIGVMLKTADPVGFERFQIAMVRVSVHIGRIFIPILRSLTEFLNSLANKFASLTAEQRETVRTITKLALALIFVVAVGGKLIGLLPGLISLVTLATNAFSYMWAAAGGPATLAAAGILLAAVALGALGGAVVVASGKTSVFMEALNKAWAELLGLLNTTQPIFDAVVDEFSKSADGLLGVVSGLYSEFIGAISSIFKSLVDIVMSLAPAFKILFYIIFGGQIIIWTLVVKAIELIALLIKWVAILTTSFIGLFDPLYDEQGGMGGFFDTIITFFVDLWNVVKTVWNIFTEFISDTIGGLISLIGWLAKLAFGGIWDGIVSSVKFIGSMFKGMINGIVFSLEYLIATLFATAAVMKAIFKDPKKLFNPEEMRKVYTDTLNESLESQKKAREERNAPAKKKTPEDDTPMLRQKVEVFSIAEAYNRVQASALEDPKLAAEREQRALIKDSNEKLEKIYGRLDEISKTRFGLR